MDIDTLRQYAEENRENNSGKAAGDYTLPADENGVIGKSGPGLSIRKFQTESGEEVLKESTGENSYGGVIRNISLLSAIRSVLNYFGLDNSDFSDNEVESIAKEMNPLYSLQDVTAIFFKNIDGNLKTFFCDDLFQNISLALYRLRILFTSGTALNRMSAIPSNPRRWGFTASINVSKEDLTSLAAAFWSVTPEVAGQHVSKIDSCAYVTLWNYGTRAHAISYASAADDSMPLHLSGNAKKLTDGVFYNSDYTVTGGGVHVIQNVTEFWFIENPALIGSCYTTTFGSGVLTADQMDVMFPRGDFPGSKYGGGSYVTYYVEGEPDTKKKKKKDAVLPTQELALNRYPWKETVNGKTASPVANDYTNVGQAGVSENSDFSVISSNASEFIQMVGHAARSLYLARENWTLPSLCIAQGAIESGWNINSRTMFGIKGPGWLCTTKEYVDGKYVTITDNFVTNNGVDANVRYYYDFLLSNNRYANLINNSDSSDCCDKVQADGYATDPNYAAKLKQIIASYHLTDWDSRTGDDPEVTYSPGQADVVSYASSISQNSENIPTLSERINQNIRDELHKQNTTPIKPSSGTGGGIVSPTPSYGVYPSEELPSGTESGFLTQYVMTENQIDSFGSWLWSEDVVTNLKKIFYDPIQAIISLQKVYFSVSRTADSEVKLGKEKTGISAKRCLNRYVNVDFGNVTTHPVHHNALDFSGTSMYIFLPFIGVKELDSGIAMNSTLHLAYNIDLLTGMCVAIVESHYSNDKTSEGEYSPQDLKRPVYTFAGKCSEDIPVTATDYTRMASALFSLGTTAATVATNPAAAIPGALNAAENLMTSGPAILSTGSISGNAGALAGRTPYVIIATHVGYGSSDIGLPEYSRTPGGQGSGHVVAHDVNLPAWGMTKEEIDEAVSIMKSGFIL